MKNLILHFLFLSFSVFFNLNAQQINKIQKNNLKILTDKEQLPANENAIKVICTMYTYSVRFGETFKADFSTDSKIYEYNKIT